MNLGIPFSPLIARLIVVYTKPILNPSFSPILTTLAYLNQLSCAYITFIIISIVGGSLVGGRLVWDAKSCSYRWDVVCNEPIFFMHIFCMLILE